MYEGLEFRHLVSFVAVAEECSFGKAAERLNIAQPSLSSQIKQIEDGLRANLFIRSQAGASLTPPGQQFLVFARKMLHMREHAVRATSSDQTGTEWPLRFGYSPFADHKLVEEAFTGYRELVPGGHIQSQSECSAELATMVADGRLDAAIVSLPVAEKELYVYPICQEKVLVCLRRDDPLAKGLTLPQNAIAARLCILFGRVHQPLFYDALVRKFAKFGIELHPSDFVSAPAEMQYLVKSGKGFGLVQESVKLDPELTMMSIAGINLTVTTGFICHPAQIRPVLPMLAYRMERQCAIETKVDGRKRPNGRATVNDLARVKKAS
jgi:DNA-binding transcriptional LysR family regulator